ncbi:MAG: 16S rRNA (cytosine(967)-C(5))-methyltransferase RsmB [Persicimonas sp.]
MPRKLAQQILEKIEREDAYSHIALDAAMSRSDLDARDRGLATEIVYGTLTWQRAIDSILDEHVRRDLDSLDVPVLVALRAAVYQMVFLDRIPAHAAVDEAVEIVKGGPSRAAAGLVNAVLRSLVRADDPKWWRDADREKKPVRYLGERYSLPNWIANRLVQYHGVDRAEEMCEAFNRRPPLYLRATGDEDPGDLPDGVTSVEGVPGALRADSLGDAVRDGLEEGRWVVQDLGSQLVTLYTGPGRGDAVLDACAGLGGKTLHLARLVGDAGRVVAVDPVASKIELLTEGAERLGLAERIEAHVARLQDYARDADERFDVVLVDAPCSGLGVLRRHPETRWRRREADIPKLVALQRELIDAAAELVRPGGALAYSVCTFTTEEGPRQVDNFLDRHDNWRLADPPEESRGVEWKTYVDETGRLALNPLEHDSDAFFAAVLQEVKE